MINGELKENASSHISLFSNDEIFFTSNFFSLFCTFVLLYFFSFQLFLFTILQKLSVFFLKKENKQLIKQLAEGKYKHAPCS